MGVRERRSDSRFRYSNLGDQRSLVKWSARNALYKMIGPYVVPRYEKMPMSGCLGDMLLFPSAHTAEHSLNIHPSGFSLLLTIYTIPSLGIMSGYDGVLQKL